MSATVKDVMTTRVAAVRKDAPYKDIATLLTQYRVSAFPVLDDDGMVIGVDPGFFTVMVKEGIVTLEGRPETVRQGRDILAEAWRVEGVVSVRDRLTYPDGM
jgi:CBS domain-containing protein